MNPKQLERFLSFAVGIGKPILVKGSPGIGKTDIIQKVAKGLKMDLVLTHPVVNEPIDYKGLPAYDSKTKEADFVPIGDLRKIVKAKKPTLCFLDDLGQAPPSVQAACMQLLLARSVGEQVVSDKVIFIAATNRKEDKAGVMGILEPVKSRFLSIVELTVDNDQWIEWAYGNDIPAELIHFINFRPGMLNDPQPTSDIVNTPSPRTVAHAGMTMAGGCPEDLLFEAIEGSAGRGFASELIGFLKVYQNLPDIDLALKHPDQVQIPRSSNDPATLYAFCGAVAEKVNDKNVVNFFELVNRIEPDYSVMAVKMAGSRDQNLKKTDPFITWISTNSHVFVD